MAPGINGEIGFLPGHVPLVTALRPGVLTVVVGGKKRFLTVSTGFAEVEGDTVTILTDACEPLESIDAARAKKAFQEASGALDKLGPRDEGYVEQRQRMARAQARLDCLARR